MADDVYLLQRLGRFLDAKVDGLRLRDWLIGKLLKIRLKDGRREFIRLNRVQRQYSRTCGRKNIVLKARQVGMTTYLAARFFVQTMTRPGTLTVQVAHSQESAEMMFNIVRRFWENLPDELREGPLKVSRANIRQLVFPRLDSEYRVETADANAGRGMTIQYLHCSEVSRWPRDAGETLASLRGAMTPDGEVVLESTPNGAHGVFYGEWQKAEETCYRKHFFPWWYEPSYAEVVPRGAMEPLTNEEIQLVKRCGLNDGQIAWRRNQWRTLRILAAQEYAEDASACFLASGNCVFELEAIAVAAGRDEGSLHTEDNGRLSIWLPPQRGKRYIIGVDTAGGGSGGDYACAEVIERTTGMQCAELHGHFPPFELARRLAQLGQRYEGALIAVERDNHGHAVLAHLKHLGYEGLYATGGQLGWLTSAVTRPSMIENMAVMLMIEPELFSSPRLLDECRTFVRRADGSTAAGDGAHDDCVMAMGIALAVRREDAGRSDKAKLLELRSLLME